MNPKISIITICYNSEKYLREAMDSVISQGYDNLEYIIIDGGSTDGTRRIIDEYMDYLTFFVSEPDGGISDAFNKGISHATGDVIGIINSDDMLLPGALQSVADAFEPGEFVFRGNTIVWNSETGDKARSVPTMRFVMSKIGYNTCHPSTFVSRICYEKYGGFSVELKYMMDVDLLYRLTNSGVHFKYVAADLAMFRIGGVTSTPYKKKLDELSLVLHRNGASCILVCYRRMAFVIREKFKLFIYKYFDGARIRRIRYMRLGNGKRLNH